MKRRLGSSSDGAARRNEGPAGAAHVAAALAVGLIGTGACSSAQADAAIAAQTAASTSLPEVVVTAQKRSQNIKDVPISITAISGGDIRASGISGYDDLTRAVPGLSFGAGGGEGLDNIEIRGVSSASGAATVGVYMDDVSTTIPNVFFDGSTEIKPFDLEQVEVLRGPQGTLYGASSLGGTIRFVQKQPNLNRFTSQIESEISTTRHGSVNHEDVAVLNAPIVPDKLAVRASLHFSRDSGYIDHYGLDGRLRNNGVNDETALAGRIAIKYEPNADWSILASVLAQDDRTGDTSVFYTSLPLWTQNKQVKEPSHDRVFLPSLTVKGNLGFADLTSITGYFNRSFNRMEDGTFYNDTTFAQFFLDPIYPDYAPQNDSLIGTLPSPIKNDSTYGATTQELRLASHTQAETGKPYKWLVGLYLSDAKDRNSNFETSPGINSVFQSIYGFPMEQSLVETTYGAPGLVLFPNDNNGSTVQKYHEQQIAEFGQFDLDILHNLHTSFGLRYTSAKVDYSFTAFGFYDIGVPSPYQSKSNFSALTPNFDLLYDINANSNVYSTISKGYRLGGPTRPVPFGPNSVCAGDFAAIGVTAQPQQYQSDSLWNYEIGSKNRLLNNKLSVNFGIYYIDWSNIQQNIYLPTCGFYYTSNVGSARSYGSELEVRYRPLDGLTLSATASYNNATITRSNNTQTVQVGEHVLNTPDWTATLSAGYRWTAFGAVTAVVQGDYAWTGHSYGSYVTSNSNYFNPSYGVFNGYVGIEYGDWSVSLFGKNLANDRTIIQHPQINTVIEGYTVRPLTVGLRASYRLD